MKTIPDTHLKIIEVKAKSLLVRPDSRVRKIFFIRKGCLRVYFLNNGKELTCQFFFEGEGATVLESFLHKEPSPFTIECIEDCELAVLDKRDFDILLERDQHFKNWFYETALQKLLTHSRRLMSFIKNKPADRYAELVKKHPEIIKRIPQHLIASYLGITAVSLSRIRSRKR